MNNNINLKIKTELLLKSIENFVDSMVFKNLFKDIVIISETKNEVLLDTNDYDAKVELNKNWKKLISRCFAEIDKQKIINFVGLETEGTEPEISQKTEDNPSKPKDIFLDFKSNNTSAKHTVQNYVKSGFNQSIFEILEEFENKGSLSSSPIFIYGNSGIGKTHFLHALGNLYINKGKKVCYISDFVFTSKVVMWMRESNHNKINEFIEWISTHDVILLDDIQGYGNKLKTLKILFEIVNIFMEEDKQIVITSDQAIESLIGFQDRLIDRFRWGLTIEVRELNKDDFIKILKYKLEERGLGKYSWDKQTLDFLAKHFNNSIRQIEGMIKRIMFYLKNELSNSDNDNVVFDLERISLIFPDQKRISEKINHETIIKATCDYLGVNEKDVLGKSRKKNIVFARDISIWLIKTTLDLTYVEIGKIFDNRDHSTIISTYKKIKDNKKKIPSVSYTIQEITKKLNTFQKH